MPDRRYEDVFERITDLFHAFDRGWRFTYVNDRALLALRELKGEELAREDLLGKNVWEMFPDAVGTTIYRKYHEAVREQKATEFEQQYPSPDGPWYEMRLYPSEEGLSIYSCDITERKRAQEEAETRAHRQAVLAELGKRALAGGDASALMDDAVAFVARALGVEYAKVVELLPGGEELLVRAGVGWDEGVVGRTTEGADLGSQAGYTLLSEGPVIVEELSTETRFGRPPLLVEHGVVGGATVAIPGWDGPFGVLGAHTGGRRAFTEDDANFLQGVANVLAMRVEREEAQEELDRVREAERSRVARDLHDEALGDLTYAVAEAQHVQSICTEEEAAQRLGRLAAALKRVGEQLRGAVYDLRLGQERERPFTDLLDTLVELHRTMAPDLRISTDVRDGLLSGPLGETGTELLRIIGEALTNARRHSGANNVRVAVWSPGDTLSVEVSDDGRGFDPSAGGPGGTGTRGMRERARLLGADLRVDSAPGEGTTVRFEMAPRGERAGPDEEVRVLLVEDHAAVREAIAAAFEQEAGFEVAAQAGSLEEARGMLEGVDVAVVDLGLPDGFGGDLIRDLRGVNPGAQAIVLSANPDRAEIARAVEAGAAGVLNKMAHLNEVVGAVRRLQAGETLMPLQEAVELLRFAGSRREEEHEARQAIGRLTSREVEVLQALAEGLDSGKVAERLHISVKTERNHTTSILNKLGVHSRLQALVFAIRHGVVRVR
ncbi:response regulator [Rubrobacter tropicus]|nr:response regulator [Rubrobacter tropicus]